MREVRKEIRPNRAVFEPGERGGLRRSLVRAGWIATGAAAALIFPAAAWAGDDQNALHPASKQEHSISVLWWVMLAGCSIGFCVVATLLLLGWVRRNRDSLPFGGGDRAGTAMVVGLGVFVPIVVLSSLFVWSDLFLIRTTEAPAANSTRMSIQVIGHDWWWEVRYPGGRAVTANEIHIPVRTRVDVAGTTADVIHSFWVPELNRKADLIPGRVNHPLLDADRPGEYRGQCAEFCGLQHAHMAVLVFVQSKRDFQSWLANMTKPAREPADTKARRGRELFLSESCSGCHQIRGTSARGQIGPDLTHVATRTTLASGTIPNTPASLADWIRDPQHFKPGNKMPALELTDGDIEALTAYLEGLK